MSDISWDILDEVNLKVAWRLVSKDMSKVFFNSRMVTVPHTEGAKYYDMMVCFTKKNVGMLDKLYQKLGLITIFMDMFLILSGALVHLPPAAPLQGADGNHGLQENLGEGREVNHC